MGPESTPRTTWSGCAEQGVRPRSCGCRRSPTAPRPHGFAPTLIGIAREKGYAGYIGDGANRWPPVHTLDAARLYRLALESAPAGSRLHAVDDDGVPFREIAAAIGRMTRYTDARASPEEAAELLRLPRPFVGSTDRVERDHPRELGWGPTHPGLIADLEQGHYFTAAEAPRGATTSSGAMSR